MLEAGAEPEPTVATPAPKIRASRLKGHTASVLTLAIDPHRPFCLASGAEDGTVRLWDTREADGDNTRELRCFGGAEDDVAVTSVSYSPDAKGSHELYAAAGEEIFCFDLRNLSGGTVADASVPAGCAHPLRTPRGLEQVDPETRAEMLADAGANVQKMAEVKQDERLERLSAGKVEDSDGSQAVVARLVVNKDEINTLAVNNKGMFLAAGDDTGAISVVDLKPLRQGRGPPKLFKTLSSADAGAGGRGHQNICAAVRFVGWRPWELLSGNSMEAIFLYGNSGLDCRILSWDFSKGKRPSADYDMTVPHQQQGNQVLNPPFVHGIQLVATAKKEHAVAAALGDGRLYWYYPNAPKPSKTADPVAYWVDDAHAAAISCLATPTELCNGSGAAVEKSEGGATCQVMTGLVATGGNDGLVKIWTLPPMGSDILSPPPSNPPSESTERAAVSDDIDAAAGVTGGSVRMAAVRVLGNKSKVNALAMCDHHGAVVYIADQTRTIKAVPL